MRKKSFGFNFRIFIYIFCCGGFADAEADNNRQTFVIRYKDGEQTIPVTVVLDYKKQTEHVINMNPRSPAKSVTLYDFKQRTIAYKDLTNGECFLGRLTHETMSEESTALQRLENPVEGKLKMRSLDPNRPALTPTEIRNLAGQKTAVFCRKMNTWLLMPDKAHNINKRETDNESEESAGQNYEDEQFSFRARRRSRNSGLSNRTDFHRSQGETDIRDFLSPGPHILPKHHSRPFPNTYFNTGTQHNAADANSQGVSNGSQDHFAKHEILDVKNTNSDYRNDYDYYNKHDFTIEPSASYTADRRIEQSTARSIAVDVPSSVHLSPLYKPLSQEFEFDPPFIPKNDDAYKNDENRSIESEFDPFASSNTHLPIHKYYEAEKASSVSENPDVSTNILEIPRITHKFESITGDKTYVLEDNIDLPLKYYDSNVKYPLNPYENSSETESSYLSRATNESNEKLYLGYAPSTAPAENFNPTNSPIYTTSENLPSSRHHRTSQSPSYNINPRNKEIDSFSKPHRGGSAFGAFPPENSLSKQYHRQEHLTTPENPTKRDKLPHSNKHRSDIPNEEDADIPFSPDVKDLSTEESPTSISAFDAPPPHRVRYQSALLDFRPDEIVIDIENIPTQAPLTVISRFQQRVITTIQPNVRKTYDSVRSDTGIRTDRTSATILSYIPTTTTILTTTTKRPRRVNARPPSHVTPGLLSGRNIVHQDPPPPRRQQSRMLRVRPSPKRQRHRFHHQNQNQPSHITAPLQYNKINHISQFDSLPPGISVHPRHPQAPFADMVNSNRPPTIPLASENQQQHRLPHRQRHHKKKDRLNGSCCRHRGKPGSSHQWSSIGPCCSRPYIGVQPSGTSCCSSPRVTNPIVRPNLINSPLRNSNHIFTQQRSSTHRQPLRSSNIVEPTYSATGQLEPFLRAESMPLNMELRKDRCEKEKMCRTLYESTQKVMVCRNAHVEGC